MRKIGFLFCDIVSGLWIIFVTFVCIPILQKLIIMSKTNGNYIYIGNIDLNQDASTGGSYTGVEPMGLFWAMKPSLANPVNNCRQIVNCGG